MPTIYSSFYATFVRQGSTLAKSISTHGYAQSVVVAGTHLNSQNRPVFGRLNSNINGRFSHLQALQLSSLHSSSSITLGLGLSSDLRFERLVGPQNHGGLDAYFEALQKQQDSGAVEVEWSQFQFPKRIEWKPSPASILIGDGKAQPATADDAAATAANAANAVEVTLEVERRASLSAEDDVALAHVNSAIATEIDDRSSRLVQVDDVATEPALVSAPAPAIAHPSRAPAPTAETCRAPTPTPTPALTPALTLAPAPAPAHTPTSAGSPPPAAPVDVQSQTYADHLLSLSEAGRYAEIPAVFEAMLATGVRPVTAAYNALLAAAVHLPTRRIEIISKALDVFADMLRRKVQPDSHTFNILVGLLASRYLEVSATKQALEEKRIRFGGMDEPGRFMFASHEVERAILEEEDRLDLALRLFDSSVAAGTSAYSSETYYHFIKAFAQAGRVSDMLRVWEHLESNRSIPCAAVFAAMITAYANSGNLVSAVECYVEYKALAMADDKGEEATLIDRQDGRVYAALVNAYILLDRVDGAMLFYHKIVREYGDEAGEIKDAVIRGGFVNAFIARGIYQDALRWAQAVEGETRNRTLSRVAIAAADRGDEITAAAAYAHIPPTAHELLPAAVALLALNVRRGDVARATGYWHVLTSPDVPADSSLIEPTAMYAVALIGSGRVSEGLAQSDMMFQRIRLLSSQAPEVCEEVDEGIAFVLRCMRERGIADPRDTAPSPGTSFHQPTLAGSPYPSSAPTVSSSFEDTFDPYAYSTDFKGSSLISDDLDSSNPRHAPRLHDALNRFHNIRRSGRHPRYITYSKLISAAARDGKMDLCRNVLAMARTDIPILSQYAVVRYGWSSILDAMVGACLTTGYRDLAEQYHQELLEIDAAPSANTYGLYITTLKESTRTFDEATEAVRIFHRARAEGVEPTSFLYNALIGKLGKARRIDDCLYYFAEMRGHGIKPTSVTYGTIVNALCRVSDEKFAEELFDEMESMTNYKARPAPYNSMMQFFLTTKHDKAKVLAYYERMRSMRIPPTSHTYKLLIDAHATLEPVDMATAEAVLDAIRAAGQRPEPVHYASLIHARGCTLHDMDGARRVFDSLLDGRSVAVNANIFQALLESMVANHKVSETGPVLEMMRTRGVGLTAYIANSLIHGWAAEKNIAQARATYDAVGLDRREPSTYEAMTRAYLAVQERGGANAVVTEMVGRGYPAAVVNKVLELLSGGQEEVARPE